MSGHNKWSKIKRDKAITDSKKSQNFSKISRAIMIAAKEGGGDPTSNPSLRLAVEKAKSHGMPKDNIERAINKALGVGGDSSSIEESVYEGYGPLGVAFMVKTATDNKNRTVSEIRNIFSKHNGSLGAAGSTAYIFAANVETPSFFIDISEVDAQKVEQLYTALEEHDDVLEVYSNYRVI